MYHDFCGAPIIVHPKPTDWSFPYACTWCDREELPAELRAIGPRWGPDAPQVTRTRFARFLALRRQRRLRRWRSEIGQSRRVSQASDPSEMPQRMQDLDSNERAELEMLRDLRHRVIGFGGDDYTIMPWVDAHRLHSDDPYIGCPFCIDEFVPRRQSRERIATRMRDWIHEQPFSKCNMGVDTCPDWDLAYDLADIVLEALR